MTTDKFPVTPTYNARVVGKIVESLGVTARAECADTVALAEVYLPAILNSFEKNKGHTAIKQYTPYRVIDLDQRAEEYIPL